MARSRSSSPTLLASARAAASSTFTSRPGEHITRASSWSSSTDPSESRLSQWTPPLTRPHRRTPCALKLGLAWRGSRSRCRRRAEVRQGGDGPDQARSFLAGLTIATGRSVASQCGSTRDRGARLRSSARATARSSEASAGAARLCVKLAERPTRLLDRDARSRANRGIGADGQVADGAVVHPVGVRMRPCSKSEQSSATGDVSTPSSA